MSIFWRELKINVKPFVFWGLGIFVLMVASMAKYQGLSAGGAAVSQMLTAFPKPIQAMFGMVGVNVMTLPGYYAVVMTYAYICSAIYGISLGSHAVGREIADHTNEFLLSKPISRVHILTCKLVPGAFYVCALSVLSYLFSLLSFSLYHMKVDFSREVLLFNIAMAVIGLVFYSLSAFLLSVLKNTEKGYLYSNLIFVWSFIVGIAYDMLEKGEFMRIFSPLRYFTAKEIVAGEFNGMYLAASCVIIIASTVCSYLFFNKRDM
mgnify:FL=1